MQFEKEKAAELGECMKQGGRSLDKGSWAEGGAAIPPHPRAYPSLRTGPSGTNRAPLRMYPVPPICLANTREGSGTKAKGVDHWGSPSHQPFLPLGPQLQTVQGSEGAAVPFPHCEGEGSCDSCGRSRAVLRLLRVGVARPSGPAPAGPLEGAARWRRIGTKTQPLHTERAEPSWRSPAKKEPPDPKEG